MVRVMMVRTVKMVRLGLMRTHCLSPLQVFWVEVLCNGRRHTVTKRYSEFQALHKQIKKTCKVPDFPTRHVPNWMPKVLEQRRQALEVYLQGVLYHNEELPQDILDFLKVRRCQQSPKASSPPTRLLPSQRPIVGFCWDPYVQPHGTGPRREQAITAPPFPHRAAPQHHPQRGPAGPLPPLELCPQPGSTPSLWNDEFYPGPRDAVVIEKDPCGETHSSLLGLGQGNGGRSQRDVGNCSLTTMQSPFVGRAGALFPPCCSGLAV
ncbi:sorting nexin-22 isoform X2 [Vidua macroura]|uniref:sorting nexin-22 isoform X2 n=1 Tax=Vidua macroura TaxID=187451 RepID=UPI0023A7D53E|nr:sorting nexin-22 isoform X2 [Vidua macroura]